jgi:hypothetical protein
MLPRIQRPRTGRGDPLPQVARRLRITSYGGFGPGGPGRRPRPDPVLTTREFLAPTDNPLQLGSASGAWGADGDDARRRVLRVLRRGRGMLVFAHPEHGAACAFDTMLWNGLAEPDPRLAEPDPRRRTC